MCQIAAKPVQTLSCVTTSHQAVVPKAFRQTLKKVTREYKPFELRAEYGLILGWMATSQYT